MSKDIRLSVTRRYSIEMAERVIKLFSPSDSHGILVFPYQTLWQYSDGDHSERGGRMRGYKKMLFSTNNSFISDMTQDRAIVTMERQ